MGEAPVNQVTAQFAFQLAEAPAFQVLEHTATQQAIGGDAGATGAGGPGTARGQALAHQLDELGVVQERVDGLEQIVFE